MTESQTPETTTQRPEDRKTEFVAVTGGRDGGASGEVLLVIAYLVMWTLLLAFVWLGWRRASRLGQKIERLERSIEDSESAKE